MNNSLHPWPDAAALRRPLPDPTDPERVRHMVEAIDRLHELSTRFTDNELRTQKLPQSVACRCLSIVGEAAAGLSPTFRQAHSAVAWQRWHDYGRHLVRAYYRINYKTLWQRWHPASQLLRQQLAAILAQ